MTYIPRTKDEIEDTILAIKLLIFIPDIILYAEIDWVTTGGSMYDSAVVWYVPLPIFGKI